eukprot:8529573-Pyramimonas_sp.AAC.2
MTPSAHVRRPSSVHTSSVSCEVRLGVSAEERVGCNLDATWTQLGRNLGASKSRPSRTRALCALCDGVSCRGADVGCLPRLVACRTPVLCSLWRSSAS